MFRSRPRRFNIISLWTFVIGGLAGATIALLFAPTTGRKLQKQLKDVLEDQVENVQTVVKRAIA